MKRIIDLEDQHFSILNESLDLRNDCQWPLKALDEELVGSLKCTSRADATQRNQAINLITQGGDRHCVMQWEVQQGHLRLLSKKEKTESKSACMITGL